MPAPGLLGRRAPLTVNGGHLSACQHAGIWPAEVTSSRQSPRLLVLKVPLAARESGVDAGAMAPRAAGLCPCCLVWGGRTVRADGTAVSAKRVRAGR